MYIFIEKYDAAIKKLANVIYKKLRIYNRF